MTNLTNLEPTKVLVIYPCTRGFSYVVMENPLKLIEFNFISPKKFDKEKLLNVIKRVIQTHEPITLVLEDCNSKHCRKGKRTKNLIDEIAKWSKRKGIAAKKYSRDQIRSIFGRWHAFTKHDIALVLSKNISELSLFIYDKPKYPTREDFVDALFCAASLAVTHYLFEE